MGYDMYLLGLPERLEPQRRRYREAHDRWRALRDRPHDDPEHRAAWEALEATPDPCYFRLSAGGMGSVRLAMLNAEMLGTEGSPFPLPAWEHLPSTRLDGGPFHPDNYYPDELCTPEQIAWMDALDRWRRFRPEGNVGIQAWKLRSNDYWIVSATECAEALAAWGSLPPARQRALLCWVAATDIEETDPSVRSWREDLACVFEATGEPDGNNAPQVVVPEAHRAAIDDFASVWDEWLGFLGLGAEGGGFMVE